MEAYRKTPGTIGTVRWEDRLLAAQPHQRGLSVEGDRERISAGRHASPDPFVQCAASGHDPLAGLFPAGHRGSAGDAHQPRLLRISPAEGRTHRATTVNAPPGADDENPPPASPTNEHAFGVDDGPDHFSASDPVPDLGHFNQALLG